MNRKRKDTNKSFRQDPVYGNDNMDNDVLR